jgi:ankyrin repeat protein
MGILYFDAFRWILDRGIYVRDFELKLADCEHSEDSLVKLCKDGDLDLVQAMLDRTEIDVNSNNNNKDTPLLAAAYNGHADVVQYLCEHGADKEARSNNNWKKNIEVVLFVICSQKPVTLSKKRIGTSKFHYNSCGGAD